MVGRASLHEKCTKTKKIVAMKQARRSSKSKGWRVKDGGGKGGRKEGERRGGEGEKTGAHGGRGGGKRGVKCGKNRGGKRERMGERRGKKGKKGGVKKGERRGNAKG